MLKIVEIFLRSESITDVESIRETLNAGKVVTIVAVDQSNQTNLLTSSDYIGDVFLLGNSTIKLKTRQDEP